MISSITLTFADRRMPKLSQSNNSEIPNLSISPHCWTSWLTHFSPLQHDTRCPLVCPVRVRVCLWVWVWLWLWTWTGVALSVGQGASVGRGTILQDFPIAAEENFYSFNPDGTYTFSYDTGGRDSVWVHGKAERRGTYSVYIIPEFVIMHILHNPFSSLYKHLILLIKCPSHTMYPQNIPQILSVNLVIGFFQVHESSKHLF